MPSGATVLHRPRPFHADRFSELVSTVPLSVWFSRTQLGTLIILLLLIVVLLFLSIISPKLQNSRTQFPYSHGFDFFLKTISSYTHAPSFSHNRLLFKVFTPYRVLLFMRRYQHRHCTTLNNWRNSVNQCISRCCMLIYEKCVQSRRKLISIVANKEYTIWRHKRTFSRLFWFNNRRRLDCHLMTRRYILQCLQLAFLGMFLTSSREKKVVASPKFCVHTHSLLPPNLLISMWLFPLHDTNEKFGTVRWTCLPHHTLHMDISAIRLLSVAAYSSYLGKVG